LLTVAAAWKLVSPITFIGARAPMLRGGATQMNGYRLDWMLEKKDGTMDLQTTDGYSWERRGSRKVKQPRACDTDCGQLRKSTKMG